MPVRHLIHIPRRVVKISLYALLLGILVFFALTRTQVGRDGLRNELETRFSRQFEGRLEIGRLTGNLVNDLYAREVRLFDPDGEVILEIDSVIAEPSWRDLFRRRLSVSSITLIRPTLRLTYGEDSTWNLARALQRSTSTLPSTPWIFSSAEVEIREGTIKTQSEGPLPAPASSGWLFNLADAEAQRLALHATIEWLPDFKLIDVLDFSAHLPGFDFDLDTLEGQFLLDKDDLYLNRLMIGLGETHLDLDGILFSVSSIRQDTLAGLGVDLTVRPSQLHFGQLRHLFPRLPLDGPLNTSFTLQGPLSNLDLRTASLQRGESRLQATGALRGFPDSLDFEIALQNAVLTTDDVQSLVPSYQVPDLAHIGPLAINLHTSGVIHAPRSSAQHLQIRADGTLTGSAGQLSTTASFWTDPNQTLHYTAQVEADSLDVGLVMQDPSLVSTLNGWMQLEGRGIQFDSLQTSLRASLGPSMLAHRPLDSLYVEATAASQRLTGSLYAAQQRGSLFANGAVNLQTGVPSYRLNLSTRDLDLGPLLRMDSLETALNAEWRLSATGGSWADLRGTASVVFDTSSTQWGQTTRTISPHRSLLTLNEETRPQPRIRLSGDMARVDLDGPLSPRLLLAMGKLWSGAVVEAVDQETAKPFAAEPLQQTPTRYADFPSFDQLLQRETVSQIMAAEGREQVDVKAAIRLERSDILIAFLPMLPPVHTDLEASLALTANADHLSLTGTLVADSLQGSAYQLQTTHAAIEVEAHLDAPLAQALKAYIDAGADTLTVNNRSFPFPSLSVAFLEAGGQVTFTTSQGNETPTFRLATALDLLPDRNRLTLIDLYVPLAGQIWTNPAEYPIDLFDQAVTVPGLILESATPETAHQRLHLYGTLSSIPTDTLFVELDQVRLDPLSNLIQRTDLSISGLLDARLVVTDISRREVTGTLTADALTLEDHLIGRLEATSRYLPGSPFVMLDLSVQPLPPDAQAELLSRNPSLRVEESRLRLGGRIRLPRGETLTQAPDPGALDLTLDAERIDIFFFERIFPLVLSNVEGAVTGGATIRGAPTHPIFEASLYAEGAFEIPLVGLSMAVSGPFSVGEEGFTLQNMLVTDPTGGSATLSGDILFNDYEFFSFDLASQVQELQIINVASSRELPFYGQIWASGEATLTGPVFNAFLRSSNAVTTENSVLDIPVAETEAVVDPGFIIFADSTGSIPDIRGVVRRANILSRRAEGERTLLEGLDMDLNIFAPQGSTIRLVFDPLLGDVINAVGSGRIQLQRREGEFTTFGSLQVDSGDYLFTASEVFVRRFLIDEGTITWDGDPLNARLEIEASYRTRASSSGLPLIASNRLIPLVVQLHITGQVFTPEVDLSLALDRTTRDRGRDIEVLEPFLNQEHRSVEYATSVLLTNSFVLTQTSAESNVLAGSAFNSVSQLVSGQVNRYLSQVIPNLDFSLGVQGNETVQDLDLTAGLAYRLLDERLIIRGQGVYRGDAANTNQQGLEGEFVVEVHLSPSVSVEVFFRREGDVLSESLLTSTTGAGLSYHTQFPTWRRLFQRIFGSKQKTEEVPDSTGTQVVEDIRK